MTIGINNKVNNFSLYNSRNSNGYASASGSFLAVGDFLNNGTVSSVLDGGLYGNLLYNGNKVSSVGLYAWNIDENNKLSFTLISTLPQSRFFLFPARLRPVVTLKTLSHTPVAASAIPARNRPPWPTEPKFGATMAPQPRR